MAFYQEDKSNGWLATSVMQHGDIFYHLSLHKLFLNIVDARFFFPIEITHQTLAYLNKRSSFKRKKNTRSWSLEYTNADNTQVITSPHIFHLFLSKSVTILLESYHLFLSFCWISDNILMDRNGPGPLRIWRMPFPLCSSTIVHCSSDHVLASPRPMSLCQPSPLGENEFPDASFYKSCACLFMCCF